MTTKLYLPALRGLFGDWVYYSCLVPAADLAERVSFAKQLHKNKQLSDMIQRELQSGRAVEIARYLERRDRFFNSLVVAVYGGEPAWHQFDKIKPQRPDISMADVPDFARESLGFLSFSGGERLFALDGQHRLAGMKQAAENDPTSMIDEVSVIFVGHKNTTAGMERTRRLFTTLNKTAKAVSKTEIIALDEDDAMAICVRRLVEEHPYFRGQRVSFVNTPNLPANDFKSLTTITNLYDVLSVLFSKMLGETLGELQRNRPTDEELSEQFKLASAYFSLLRKHFSPLRAFFDSASFARVVANHRTAQGGHLLFRPAGLLVLTEVIVALSGTMPLPKAVELAAELPQDLSTEPFRDVLWDPVRRRMINGGRALTRRLLLYAAGSSVNETSLRTDYAKRIGSMVRAKKVLRSLAARRPTLTA